MIDTKQLEAWITYLTIGLIWHHWTVVVARKVDIKPMLLTSAGEKIYAPLFHLKASRRVPITSIGGDALIYEAVMDRDNPLGSLWRFAIYGGAQWGGDNPRVRASTYYVMVTPKEVRADNASATSAAKLEA